MRLAIIISIIVLSSCAGSRPKYVANNTPVKAPMVAKKQKANMQMHIVVLIWAGVIFHFANENSK